MRYALLITTVITALFFRAFIVSVYKVPTQTMAPNLLAGDFIFASQIAYGLKLPWADEAYFSKAPARGDLVVYLKNSKIYIKRVVASANDSVEYINGELIINSEKCQYKLLNQFVKNNLATYEETCSGKTYQIIKPIVFNSDNSIDLSKSKINESQVLAMSDNRSMNDKSYFFDFAQYDQLIGKPVIIWMSYITTQDFISNSLGLSWNRILTKVN